MEFGTRIRTHKEEMDMTMTVRIEIEGKAEDFQELFVPSDRQQEFIEMTFDAYTEALKQLVWKQIDPHNFTGLADAKKR
jgi:hypothetical protein